MPQFNPQWEYLTAAAVLVTIPAGIVFFFAQRHLVVRPDRRRHEGLSGPATVGRMRMFVALVPPDEAIDHLDEFLAVRREAAPFRWTLPEQIHVTLSFLAQVPDRRLDDLVERLERAARRRTPVTTRVAGGGAFPNPSRARVLWARARPRRGRAAPRCRGWRPAPGRPRRRRGSTSDGQRFRPHLTLARLGRPDEVSSWVRLLDGYAGPAWTTDRVDPDRLPPRRGAAQTPALRGG